MISMDRSSLPGPRASRVRPAVVSLFVPALVFIFSFVGGLTLVIPLGDLSTMEPLRHLRSPVRKYGDFRVLAVKESWGTSRYGTSFDGRPLTIGGTVYASGIGTHAHSEILLIFGRDARRLTGGCGVDSEVNGHGSAVCKILAGNETLFESDVARGGAPAVRFDIDVRGYSAVTLLASPHSDGIDGDHVDWVDLALS